MYYTIIYYLIIILPLSKDLSYKSSTLLVPAILLLKAYIPLEIKLVNETTLLFKILYKSGKSLLLLLFISRLFFIGMILW